MQTYLNNGIEIKSIIDVQICLHTKCFEQLLSKSLNLLLRRPLQLGQQFRPNNQPEGFVHELLWSCHIQLLLQVSNKGIVAIRIFIKEFLEPRQVMFGKQVSYSVICPFLTHFFSHHLSCWIRQGDASNCSLKSIKFVLHRTNFFGHVLQSFDHLFKIQVSGSRDTGLNLGSEVANRAIDLSSKRFWKGKILSLNKQAIFSLNTYRNPICWNEQARLQSTPRHRVGWPVRSSLFFLLLQLSSYFPEKHSLPGPIFVVPLFHEAWWERR